MPLRPLPRFLALALTAAVLGLLAACNSTSVVDTWTAPDVTKLNFKTILIVAPNPDPVSRRMAEDAVKALVTRTECIASYTLLGETDLTDLPKVKAMVKAAGVDAVVVLRLASNRDEISYVPGSVYPMGSTMGTPMGYPMGYRSFGGYYSRSYALDSFYYEPGHYTSDRIVEIEANIYETAGERLIWSGLTKTKNPGNLTELATNTGKAIKAELVKDKLIPAS